MYEIRNMLKGNEGHRCNLMGREVVDPFEILREDQAGMHVASIFDAVNTMKGLGLRTEARPYQEFVNTNGLTKSESLDKEKLDYFTLRSGLAIDGQILDLAEFRYLD